MEAGRERFLSAEELTILHAIVEVGSAAEVRRAQIILGWGEGLETDGIAERAGLSARTVSKWIQDFGEKRLGIFDAGLIQPLPRAEPAPNVIEPISIEQLCRINHIDMDHAVHVGQLARVLLEATKPLHNLEDRYGNLIYFAGLLHNVAYSEGVQAHHTRGRDILLNTPLTDLNDTERTMVAITTVFHRKPWKSERHQREASYTMLEESLQPTTRWLSALLRIADGLDYSGSQTTRIKTARVGADGCEVIVNGPQAESDAARADEKADMWRALTGIPLKVMSEQEARRRARRPHVSKKPARFRISPDELMAEAGRKVIRFHFARMLYHEPGTRLSEDSEALHDMRVAVRRMRSALDLFGPHLNPKTQHWIGRGLQRTGRKLGAVRDWDVAFDQVKAFMASQPAGEMQVGLGAFMVIWERQRGKAQRQMLDYLDSDRYFDFIIRLQRFCEKANTSKQQSTLLVAYTAPTVIYQQYEAVRAYEAGLVDAPVETLHALRMNIKQLRYTLEFLKTALGRETREAINELVAAQDHFGALHDADATIALIRRTLKKDYLPEDDNHAANLYLRSLQDDLQRLRETAPVVFQKIVTAEFRQKLALTISVL
jgi:CHAD domain-containing protein